MAGFDIKQIVSQRLGENYELHEKYINPTLVKVFRTIGFDRVYTKAKGQYLWDKDGNRYLDMLSGFGVYSIGSNHPKVAQARAPGSLKAICQVGSFSSLPAYAPTNVGASTAGFCGYKVQNPTESINRRASSMVLMPCPFKRHFSRRSSCNCCSNM